MNTTLEFARRRLAELPGNYAEAVERTARHLHLYHDMPVTEARARACQVVSQAEECAGNELMISLTKLQHPTESFECGLHQLADGKVQLLWREPISGEISISGPRHRDAIGLTHANLACYAWHLQKERITLLDGVPIQLRTEGGRTFASWCDSEGVEREAYIHGDSQLPFSISDERIKHAINTPSCWI